MANKLLYVYPNPFIHLDHDGYPNGACPCDMFEHVGLTTRKWVAASLDQANTVALEKLSREEQLYRTPKQQTRFKFDFSEPTALPVSEYYKDRIRSGELIAADAKTYRLAGLSGDFESPVALLAAAKAKAIADWEAACGPGERPEHVDSFDTQLAAIAPACAPSAPSAPSVAQLPPVVTHEGDA